MIKSRDQKLKPRHLIGWLMAVAAALALRVAAAESTATHLAAADRIVVMISVDGLAADYLDDPKAEMPTLCALAAGGARAALMKASTPTVTWPNHTTLVTGITPARHGVVGNNYLDRATGKKVTLIADPVYDKDQIVKVPTIYDLAKAAELKTAAIRWPASRHAATLDWTVPDVRSAELISQYSTPALLVEAKLAGIDIVGEAKAALDQGDQFEPPDEMYTRAFNFILRQHRPNLALLHVTKVDHTQHLKGPRTEAAYAEVKAADQEVREVWDELKRDFPDRATLVVVSDHGFSAINRVILPNVVLRKAGLLTMTGEKETGGPVQVVVQGGSAFLYVRDGEDRAQVLDRVRKAFSNIQGVSKVVGAGQFKDYGVADPQVDPHAPDIILFAQEGCTFGDTAAGELPFNEKPERKGSHGHDPNLPHLGATFVAWGVGIKPGVRLGEISNTSVAPTLAKLLGIAMPNVEGKPLSELLTD
jgi:predicted AlkP superfamily pyrophosphatase or phosphodiesterase